MTMACYAGDWHPSMYRSAPTMTAVSLDWEDRGPGGSSAEQAGGLIGTGNGLAATVMQERQASYMYIMPQEHLSSKDSPEVRCTVHAYVSIDDPRVDHLHVPRVQAGAQLAVGHVSQWQGCLRTYHDEKAGIQVSKCEVQVNHCEGHGLAALCTLSSVTGPAQ